eukprot:CAMPEP_0172378716 /NCGR_PEP_ID=MMETSP1060-20121228/69564_1 /TAXON_ID=37318 /ORGANISM="Pseudo-nitzschia pungens, Strain cf. cingulata" /LENGTH=279 /DNA_ID=CAMNT_0013106443 /DNA_START=659 /DNA_END=1501 /DNA_ORIENTATION=+
MSNHPDTHGDGLTEKEKDAMRDRFIEARMAFEMLVEDPEDGTAILVEEKEDRDGNFDSWFRNETGLKNPFDVDIDPETMKEVAEMTEKLGGSQGMDETEEVSDLCVDHSVGGSTEREVDEKLGGSQGMDETEEVSDLCVDHSVGGSTEREVDRGKLICSLHYLLAHCHNFTFALLGNTSSSFAPRSTRCVALCSVWALARMVTSAVKSGGDAASILRLEAGDVKGPGPVPGGKLEDRDDGSRTDARSLLPSTPDCAAQCVLERVARVCGSGMVCNDPIL